MMPSSDELGRDREQADEVAQPDLSGYDDNQPLLRPERQLTGDQRYDELVAATFDRPLPFPGSEEELWPILQHTFQYGTDPTTWKVTSPTATDPRSIELASGTVDRAVEYTSLMNPDMAADLPQSPSAMLLLAEVSASAQDGYVGPQILEALYGEDFSQADIGTDTDEYHLQVYDYIHNKLSPSANLAVMISVAGLTRTPGDSNMPNLNQGRHPDSFLASVKAYIDNNDMSAPGAMENFIVWQYQQAYGKQQEIRQEGSLIGFMGEIVSQPVRATSHAFAKTWANVASPQDAWSNQFLSPGQNVAISMGQDPGTSGYDTASGTIDGVFNIVGDPISWAANVAMGAKLIKGQALLANVSRGQLLRKAIVPFAGKRSFTELGVRGSTRFISNRVGIALGARTTEQLTTSPKALRLFDVLAKADSMGMIIHHVPEWQRAPDLVAAVAKSTDPTEIQTLVRQSMEGAFDKVDNFHLVAVQALDDATVRFDDALRASTRSRQLALTLDEVQQAVAPAGKKKISELADLLDVDVRNSTRPHLEEPSGAATVDRMKEDILSGGFDPAATDEGPILLQANPRTGEYFLSDGNHRVTALMELVEEGKIADDAIEVTVRLMTDEDIAFDAARVADSPSTSYIRTAPGTRAALDLGGDISLRSVNGLGGYHSSNGVWLADEVSDGATTIMLNGDGKLKVIAHEDAVILKTSSFTDATGEKGLDGLLSWLNANATDDAVITLDNIADHARKAGFDAYEDAAGNLTILNEKKFLTGIDGVADPLTDSNLIGMANETFEKAAEARRLNAGNRNATWIINEMPTGKIPDDIDTFNKPRPTFWSGGSTSKHYWVRAAKSRAFGKYPPSAVSITDARQGRMDLQNFLRYVGVHEDDVVRITTQYLEVPIEGRYRYIRDAVVEAAELVDNPIIKHNLIEYVNRGSVSSFGHVGGQEVLRTGALSGTGAPVLPHLGVAAEMVARPFVPSLLAPAVDLPDPVMFSKALHRYRTASRMGPMFRRGYSSATKAKREALVSKIERELRDQYGSTFDFSPEDIEAMAYSVVGGGAGQADGLGAVAHVAEGLHRSWMWTRQAFSIAQLVGRFAPWASRIWIDENLRAVYADMPTLLTNPKRFLSAWKDGHVLRQAGTYRAENLAWATKALDDLKAISANPAQMRDNARAIIRNIDELAPNEWKNMTEAESAIASILNEHAIKNDFGQIITTVSPRRQRQYQRAIDIADDMGLDATRPDFNFAQSDLVKEIVNDGFAVRHGLAHSTRPVKWTDGITKAGTEQYSAVYHDNLVQFTKDPLIRYYGSP
jgi:hypothetical protein